MLLELGHVDAPLARDYLGQRVIRVLIFELSGGHAHRIVLSGLDVAFILTVLHFVVKS